MRYLTSLVLILAALWLSVSGVYKPLIVLLGAASVALVVWLSRRMEVVGSEHYPVLFSWRLPAYWGWLVGQIVRANLHMARLVLNPRDIRPSVIKVPTDHHSAVARTTFANSITLTPGTVSLHLNRGEVTVHALDEHSARELKAGTMTKRVAWLEGGEKKEQSE